jgi:hypothetical protein
VVAPILIGSIIISNIGTTSPYFWTTFAKPAVLYFCVPILCLCVAQVVVASGIIYFQSESVKPKTAINTNAVLLLKYYIFQTLMLICFEGALYLYYVLHFVKVDDLARNTTKTLKRNAPGGIANIFDFFFYMLGFHGVGITGVAMQLTSIFYAYQLIKREQETGITFYSHERKR